MSSITEGGYIVKPAVGTRASGSHCDFASVVPYVAANNNLSGKRRAYKSMNEAEKGRIKKALAVDLESENRRLKEEVASLRDANLRAAESAALSCQKRMDRQARLYESSMKRLEQELVSTKEKMLYEEKAHARKEMKLEGDLKRARGGIDAATAGVKEMRSKLVMSVAEARKMSIECSADDGSGEKERGPAAVKTRPGGKDNGAKKCKAEGSQIALGKSERRGRNSACS